MVWLVQFFPAIESYMHEKFAGWNSLILARIIYSRVILGCYEKNVSKTLKVSIYLNDSRKVCGRFNNWSLPSVFELDSTVSASCG